MSKILVIGGSYFTGRIFVFSVTAMPNVELYVLNRGKYRLNRPGVTEIICNRHDTAAMSRLLKDKTFDAVIDFCAYEPGDIKSVIESLCGNIRQYIYISTASVYRPSCSFPKTEESALVTEGGTDAASQYIWKKLLLEEELRQSCTGGSTVYTILRPAFIYGPFNYAPREAYYFERIIKGIPIHVPTDSISLFQFVYVEDVAKAIRLCIGNEKAYDNICNLSAPELVCYQSYMETLKDIADREFQTVSIPTSEVYLRKIPLPFPLDRHELFSGEKAARQLGLQYTPFGAGMQETYNASKNIWINTSQGGL